MAPPVEKRLSVSMLWLAKILLGFEIKSLQRFVSSPVRCYT